MKIRIRGQSLRLRLQRQDVKQLLETNLVIDQTVIGLKRFYFAIESSESANVISASFDGEGIRIIAPRKTIQGWAQSEELSLYAEQPAIDGSLKILVEKDLMCIKPRSSPMWEDESDAYPNPNTSCGGSHG